MQRHQHDAYTFANGRTVRFLNADILVQMNPEEETTAGGIIRPGDAVEHVYMSGKVLAFGYITEMKKEGTSKTRPLAEPFPIPDIEVGMECCFIRYRRWQDTNKQFRQRFGDDIICLKPEDLLFVSTEEIDLS